MSSGVVPTEAFEQIDPIAFRTQVTALQAAVQQEIAAIYEAAEDDADSSAPPMAPVPRQTVPAPLEARDKSKKREALF